MTTRLLAVLLLGLVTLPMCGQEAQDIPSESTSEKLELASLRSECSLTKEWVGSVYQLPWGAWLECGGEPMLVTHPLNLIGKVTTVRWKGCKAARKVLGVEALGW